MTRLQVLPLSRPATLQVEITTNCNLRCKMCPVTTRGTPSTLSPGRMHDAVWEQVRELSRQAGTVMLTGYGEPFVHPRFLGMLRELDDLGVNTIFSTNGILVTEPAVRELAALKRLVHVNVSIDSPDPAVYRAIRGGDVERALAGLRRLAAGLPGPPPHLTVSSVLMESTLASLVGFPQLLAAIGVRSWVIQSMTDWNADLRLQHLVHRESSREGVERIKAAAAAAGVACVVENPARLDLELADAGTAARTYHDRHGFSDGHTKQCTVPWEVPFVNKNGQVFPCCLGDHTAVMGDLRDQTFDEVWQGERFERFRADLTSGEAVPAICRRCTQAPAGRHPYRDYAARLRPDRSILAGSECRLVVQNTGEREWTPETMVRIGTADRRDRPSALYHPSWIAPHRIGTFVEDRVPPGAEATFRFACAPTTAGEPEAFALVVECVAWLPQTRFAIAPVAAGPHPAGRAA